MTSQTSSPLNSSDFDAALSTVQSLTLKDFSLSSLEAFLRYTAYPDTDTAPVAFSYKIHDSSDSLSESKQILSAFEKAVQLIAPFKIALIDEATLLKDPSRIDALTQNAIAITCRSGGPLSDKEERIWNQIIRKLEARPELIRFLCASDDTFTSRFRKNEHLYYRVFRCDIVQKPFALEDVKPLLYRYLTDDHVVPTEDFDRDITAYIQTVYPKADLQGAAFTKNLEERVLQKQALLRPERVADSSCVPYYQKPEEKIARKANSHNQYTQNVLLMAMSILPPKPRTTSFSLKGDASLTIDNCVGQLEPVVKYMLRDDVGGTAEQTHIIILCTAPTKTAQSITLNEKSLTITALDFFKTRITEAFPTKDIIFHDLDCDPYAPEAGIKSAVDSIRELYKANLPTRFWIDTHGGLRDLVQTMTAIISLLKVDHIIPEHIYGIDTSAKEIVDQAYAFHIFDFVSGMESFIRKGDADQLLDYYDENQDESIKNIVHAMSTVSNGIQMSDPNMYTAGLDQLSIAIDDLPATDSMLAIFSDYIRRDYGVLLDKDKRTAVQIIRRCTEKKLIQQALTFAESLMPEEIMKRKLLDFDLTGLISEGRTISLSEIKRDNKKKYQSDHIYLFDTFINLKLHYFTRKGETSLKAYASEQDINENDYLASSALKSVIESASYLESLLPDKCSEVKNPDSLNLEDALSDRACKLFQLKYKSAYLPAPISVNSDENNRHALGIFLVMHKIIKNCRNMFNHSSVSNLRPSIKDLRILLDLYVKYAEVAFAPQDQFAHNEAFNLPPVSTKSPEPNTMSPADALEPSDHETAQDSLYRVIILADRKLKSKQLVKLKTQLSESGYRCGEDSPLQPLSDGRPVLYYADGGAATSEEKSEFKQRLKKALDNLQGLPILILADDIDQQILGKELITWQKEYHFVLLTISHPADAGWMLVPSQGNTRQ